MASHQLENVHLHMIPQHSQRYSVLGMDHNTSLYPLLSQNGTISMYHAQSTPLCEQQPMLMRYPLQMLTSTHAYPGSVIGAPDSLIWIS